MGAKRKSVPQSSSAPVQIPVQAKKPKTDDDVEGIIEDVDVKGIKAEPEPSGSGVSAPNVNPMVEAELDDSYHGGGADDDNGDFGGGEEFEGFDQHGDGNEFDDSLGAAGASASAGADGKEDNWPPEDYVLKENEILINRPLFPCVGMGNSIIVQDEHGFKYRKSHNTRHATHIQNWKCSKINHGCKCSIKTRGETIIMQRNQHNHDVNEYKQFKKF